MYYSKQYRERKLKEVANNKAFIEYAQKEYKIYRRVSNFDGYDTFEAYLVGNVFALYENFTLLELIRRADTKTINCAIDILTKEI